MAARPPLRAGRSRSNDRRHSQGLGDHPPSRPPFAGNAADKDYHVLVFYCRVATDNAAEETYPSQSDGAAMDAIEEFLIELRVFSVLAFAHAAAFQAGDAFLFDFVILVGISYGTSDWENGNDR